MTFISENNLAALIGTSNRTVQTWGKNGLYPRHQQNGVSGFDMDELRAIPEVNSMLQSNWEKESTVVPARQFNSIELFAGGGGLALGMSLAGFHHVLLNEFDTSACKTLKTNKPEWNVIEGDVRHIDFSPLQGKVDFLSGGFPCQAFSYAGKGAGFNDTRGTLFFELARAVKEIQPKVFMGENVKGLISHENGRTFETIKNAIAELGYTLVEPRVLRAIMYQVPQKRERLVLIAIRNDIAKRVEFHWPTPYHEVLTLRDALYKSVIYDKDVPASEGAQYPEKKKKVLEMVPQGGDWRNLPEDIAKEYMGGSWLLGGGKTGMARRLSLDEPSLTLTCSPGQKQTERCHPLETRPLSVREYARIQTFPDSWNFQGSMSDKYKQIGNAVPVRMAEILATSIKEAIEKVTSERKQQRGDIKPEDRVLVGFYKGYPHWKIITHQGFYYVRADGRKGAMSIEDLLPLPRLLLLHSNDRMQLYEMTDVEPRYYGKDYIQRLGFMPSGETYIGVGFDASSKYKLKDVHIDKDKINYKERFAPYITTYKELISTK